MFFKHNPPANKSFNFLIQQSLSSSDSGQIKPGQNMTIQKDAAILKMPKNIQLAAPASMSKLLASSQKQQINGSSISRPSFQTKTIDVSNSEFPNLLKMQKGLSLTQTSSVKPVGAKKK